MTTDDHVASGADATAGISRRHLIKRGAAAIPVLLGGSALLQACGDSDESSPSTTEGESPGTTAAPGTAAAPSGKITVATFGRTIENISPIFAAFAADSGIEVELVESPASAGTDVTQQLTPQFAAGETPFDVFISADESTPPFIAADWLLPIDDALDEGFLADVPASMLDYMDLWSRNEGGELFRVPLTWQYSFYWSRADLLADLGIEAPRTWDDLLAVGDAARSADLFAYADAISRPAAAFVAVSFLAQQAGGDPFAVDEGTRQAFQFLVDLNDAGLLPPDAVSWDLNALNAAYFDDRVLSMRQWGFVQGVAQENAEWYEPEKMTIELPPEGPVRSSTWAGGWGFCVPKFTSNPDAAMELIRFVSQADTASAMAAADATYATTRAQALADAGDGDPILNAMGRYEEAGVVVPRPFHPKVAEAQEAIDNAITSVLSGQGSIDSNLEQARETLDRL